MLDSSFKVLDGPAHPYARGLFVYWRSKCRAEGLPGRPDIDPADFLPQLPFIILLDVEDQGADFRVRVFGTGVVRVLGRELTGQRLSEIDPPAVAAKLSRAAEACRASGRPLFARSTLMLHDRDHIGYELIALPLAADGRTVDKILGVVCFD